jgi:hypothetical protein
MFSKKTVLSAGVIGLVILITLGYFILLPSQNYFPGCRRSRGIVYCRSGSEHLYHHHRFYRRHLANYFFLVSVSRENEALRKRLAEAFGQIDACSEIASSPMRLREYVGLVNESPIRWLPPRLLPGTRRRGTVPLIINKGSTAAFQKGARSSSRTASSAMC